MGGRGESIDIAQKSLIVPRFLAKIEAKGPVIIYGSGGPGAEEKWWSKKNFTQPFSI